jgi:hypothetical protein
MPGQLLPGWNDPNPTIQAGDLITQYYQKYLGRTPSQEEIDSHLGNPGGYQAVERLIKTSPEAQAYAAQQKAAPPPPAAGSGSTSTAGGTDVRAFIAQLAQMPGADPSLAKDPDYWVNAINSRGGLTDANRQYWQDAAVGPTAFFNNPNREQGGSAGSGTTGAAPTFTPPAYTKPPAFSYADFVAPDPSQVASDPWTQYTLKTQQDAVQKSAAARGMLTTGGTINDLMLNAADIANQGYQGIYNRAQQTYAADRGNALDAYNLNYGTQYTDPYHYQYQGAQDAYNAAAHNYDQARSYDWAGTLFGEQQQQDQWANKFKLLGLV